MKNSGELIKAIKSRDSSVRRHAIEMLGTRGDEIVIDALIPVLKDNNRFVRQEAIIALEKIGGERIDLGRHAFENEVKAVTRHKFGIKKNQIWCIQVVLDV
jgi:HEAT repeat protein